MSNESEHGSLIAFLLEFGDFGLEYSRQMGVGVVLGVVEKRFIDDLNVFLEHNWNDGAEPGEDFKCIARSDREDHEGYHKDWNGEETTETRETCVRIISFL